MRVSTIYAILLFSLMVRLAGCQVQNPSNLPDQEVSQLRIIVPGEGYYQITRKDWEKNGLTVQDLDRINLLYQGESYPYWFNDEPDSNDLAIRFHAPPVSHDINLSENVFILSTEQTKTNRRITPIKPLPAQGNFYYKSTGNYREKIEQQTLYLPQVPGEDRWLWALFQPNQPISQEIQLPQESVDQVTIRVQVWVTPTNAEHPAQQFSATMNGQVLESVQVESQGWQVIEFHLNGSYKNSRNHLTIQPVTSPDDLPAKIYLDWIEIEYSIPIDLGTQFQSFTIADSRLLTSTNTSSGTLVTADKNQPLLDVYALQSGHQFTFTHLPATTYEWIPDNHFLPVSSLQPIPKEVLSFPSQPIDYLVIAPENYQQALAPLINLREEQGLVTLMVSPQQIYDVINAGTPSVDALKEFVQSIYDYDPERLKYLLLVGDYSYEIVDYQEFLGYVPSFFVSSGMLGETVSDFPYADLHPDLSPELTVGRIPASTPEQVIAWVEKVILYEGSIPSDWNRIIAISDSSDPYFYEYAQNFVLPMVNDHKTKVIHAPIPGEIQEIFKSSYTLVGYFGHGSIDLLGKEKIFSIPMLSELPKSSAPPVLISFSCLNGYFIHPEKLSLAEGLLFYPGGGVIGIFAPTGQTLMEEHEKLLQFLQNKLQSNDHSRIGNLIYHQKGENFPEDYSVTNNFQTYIYFGDPAMLIP